MDTQQEPRAFVNAAVTYATRHRWRVLPVHGVHAGRCSCGRPSCEHPGKHPRLTGWPTQATTDASVIARWWHWWPAGNVGICTGDGLLVLDVDGDEGAETLAALERQHGPFPDTPRSFTGGNGAHYLLTVDGPVGNKVRIAPGVDIRGTNGFIVAPPSRHISGRVYCWNIAAHPDEVPVAPAPRWLLALIATASHSSASIPGVELRLEHGERNDRLYRLACGWRRKGVGHAALRAMLDAVNCHHCVPPLDDSTELDRIAASAARYAPGGEDDAGAADVLLAQALGMAVPA